MIHRHSCEIIKQANIKGINGQAGNISRLSVDILFSDRKIWWQHKNRVLFWYFLVFLLPLRQES